MRNWIVASLFIPLLIALLAAQPFAVWDGNFKLDITLKADSAIAEAGQLPSQIDTKSLLFATAWNVIERDAILSRSEDFDFHTPVVKESGQLEISVPCSGREGWFGLNSTYYQPKFVVVEFRPDSSHPSLRKSFPVPEGRGRKSMTIEFP